MSKIQVYVTRCGLQPYTKKDGTSSTYYELQFVHGTRPKTSFDAASGQRINCFDQTGKQLFDDDIQVIEFFGSDAQYMSQCQLLPNTWYEMDLHSTIRQNQYTRRYETNWLLPTDIRVVQAQTQAAPAQQTLGFGR